MDSLTNAFRTIGGLLQFIAEGLKTFFLPAEPFWNVLNVTIPAGQQALLNQAIDLKLGFPFYIYAIANSNVNTPVVMLDPDFLFEIKGTGGGVQFQNSPIRASALMWGGNSSRFWFRRPFCIVPKGSLTMSFFLLAPLAADFTIQWVYLGWKGLASYTSPNGGAS